MAGPPPASGFGYGVRTTYQPNLQGDDEVVPAVPQHQHHPQGAWGAAPPPGAWGAVPQPMMQPQPQQAHLAFTGETTVL